MWYRCKNCQRANHVQCEDVLVRRVIIQDIDSWGSEPRDLKLYACIECRTLIGFTEEPEY